jgi:hypothetical protein
MKTHERGNRLTGAAFVPDALGAPFFSARIVAGEFKGAVD